MGLLKSIWESIQEKNELEKFDEWARSASIEELSAEFEKNRQKWIKTGYYGPTEPILKREMNKRLEEKAKNNPYRNTDPNYYWSDENRWEK